VVNATCIQQAAQTNCDVLSSACDSQTPVVIFPPGYGKDHMGDFSVEEIKRHVRDAVQYRNRAYNSARPMTVESRCSWSMDVLRPKGFKNVGKHTMYLLHTLRYASPIA
jgi:hypothetical protein